MTQQAEYAERIPSKHLPPVPYRDLPEPKGVKSVFGASIILTALGIGSGETVLWPSITAQVGLILMWAALLSFITQTFVNMEIERYTIATGETAITGFTRLWKPWGSVFAGIAIITHIFPGWATGSATLLTFTIGGGNATYIAIAGLIAIGVALSLSPVVYQAVEKAETVMVAGIAIFLVLILFLGTTGEAWGALASGFGQVGQFPEMSAVGGAAALFGAIAFAGVGGTGNLAQSNWIRDKGLGMGHYAPRIVSPITGKDEAASGIGTTFPPTEENLRRWRGWWKIANVEQFITFFALGFITLTIMCVMAYATVFGQELPDEDFAFLAAEGRILGERVGDWFKIGFWGAITLALFSTQLAVLDYTGRMVADNLKVSWLRNNDRITESRIYYTVLWLVIASATVVLLSGLEEPLILLLISAVSGGITMTIYSVLLIIMNRKFLPEGVRLTGYRVAIMVWAVLFYGTFGVIVAFEEIGALF